jgi:hypothetical protein
MFDLANCQKNGSFLEIMSTNKYAFIASVVITVVSFCVSIAILPCQENTVFFQWLENASIGLFASGILMLFSSGIGYRKEEEHTFREYHWKLSELKKISAALETLPVGESNIDDYIEATFNLDGILTEYFAVVDIDFMFKHRKKVQKLYEIHNQLKPLKTFSGNALLKMCEYRCRTLNDEGIRYYPFNNFKDDIQDFINSVDNYNESGLKLSIWIEKKEREYGEEIFGYR